MKIKRTANAGVLITLSGETFLLDGVCGEVYPYIKTPQHIREEIEKSYPDNVLFTHYHDDHYDEAFAKDYELKTLRSVIGPESQFVKGANGAEIISVPTRHIGKFDFPHVSFIIKKEESVWFMGDVSALALKEMKNYEKPDVLIVPYACVNTLSSVKSIKEVGAKKIVVLHLPERKKDEYKLWDAVEKCTENETNIFIPEMGEIVEL